MRLLYVVTEDWYFLGEDDTDVCRIRATLTATGTRSDCTVCTWAHDLVLAGSAVVAESDVGCDGVFGAGAAAALEGAGVAYGFAEEYYGHPDVLMVGGDAGWAAAGFARWDEVDGGLEYDIEDGVRTY